VSRIPIQVESDQWDIVQNILKKYLPNHKVCAFGSRAKWRANKFSDLDIVVETESDLPPLLLAEIRTAFSESLLPWNVDVIDAVACDPVFLNQISKDKVIIWSPK